MPGKFDIFKALKANRIAVVEAASKYEILDALIDILAEAPEVLDADALTMAIAKREEMMSTGLGRGIAIPHVRINEVTDLVMAVGLVRNGIPDYDSMDGETVKLVFMSAARPDQHEEHLRLLSHISGALKRDAFLKILFSAPNSGALFQLLAQELSE